MVHLAAGQAVQPAAVEGVALPLGVDEKRNVPRAASVRAVIPPEDELRTVGQRLHIAAQGFIRGTGCGEEGAVGCSGK